MLFVTFRRIIYGACIYLRVVDISGIVHLLCAKSRVAQTISLPRLELYEVLLLLKLMGKVQTFSRIGFESEIYWTDSTITLVWIESHPNRWKTFVANRVTQIQANSRGDWCHVLSRENLLSREIRPSTLQNSRLWWDDPWLREDHDEWLRARPELPERWAPICVTVSIKQDSEFEIFDR